MGVTQELGRLYREYYANRLSHADYRYQRGLLLDSLMVTEPEPDELITVSRDQEATDVAPDPPPEPEKPRRGVRWPAVAAICVVLLGGTIYVVMTQLDVPEAPATSPVESEPVPAARAPAAEPLAESQLESQLESQPESVTEPEIYIEPDVGQPLVEAFLERDDWTVAGLQQFPDAWGRLPAQDRIVAKGAVWFAPLADRLEYEIDEAAEFSDSPDSDQRLQQLYAMAVALGVTELAPENWKPGLAARSVPREETAVEVVEEELTPEKEPVIEETVAAPATPIVHDDACSAEQLQTRRRGCFDLLASGAQGPAMRVISAGSVVGVTVDAPFAISALEISSAQYAEFCGQSGADCPENPWPGSNMPVVNVSWNDVVAYCDWLSGETGYRYRLPTDAEWEYAARAGSTTDYPFGDEITAGQARYSSITTYDAPLSLDDRTTQRNEFRLWHVVGNVREWVGGSGGGEQRTTRGGSYADDADGLRLSSRHTMPATTRDTMTGFRVVREL